MNYHHGLSAVILAAGYSRRMGEFKPLMNLGGRTVLSRIVSLYRDAGVMDIRVVTGHRANAIQSALYARPASVVHNPIYESGMFSSVVAGIDSLPVTSRAFFIHPVDIPLVQAHTLSLLADAFNELSPAVVYPVFNGKRGHPPLIHSALKDAIACHDGCGGLRSLLLRFDSSAQDIQVADEGVLLDLDTPDDYRRLSTRLATVAPPAEKNVRNSPEQD